MKVVLVSADKPDSMFLELRAETDYELAVLKLLLDCPLRVDQGATMQHHQLTLQIKRDRP